MSNVFELRIDPGGAGGGAGGGGVAIQGSGTSVQSYGTVQFRNSNSVSFGLSSGTMTARFSQSTHNHATLEFATSDHYHGALDTQAIAGSLLTNSSASSGLTFGVPAWITTYGSYFSAGVSTGGNTVGNTSIVGNQLVFAGGNNITLSQETAAGGATVTISAGAAGASINFSDYDGSANLDRLVFSNSNNVSFTLNGSTLNASASYSQSVQPAVREINNSSGFIVFYAHSSLSSRVSESAITFGLASDISTAFQPAGAYLTTAMPLIRLSMYAHPGNAFNPLDTIGQGSLSLKHMYVPFYITGTAAKIGGLLSAHTADAATTASANMSLSMGIYTLNGSTLSLASSGSANNAFAWSHSDSSTANTSVDSLRQLTVPINVNMTPGEYWIGALISSATTYTSADLILYGNGENAWYNPSILSPLGSDTSVANFVVPYQGIYTAATNAFPSAIVKSDINRSGNDMVKRADFFNMIYNNNY
jgi:hypothetical protein